MEGRYSQKWPLGAVVKVSPSKALTNIQKEAKKHDRRPSKSFCFPRVGRPDLELTQVASSLSVAAMSLCRQGEGI